MKVEKIAGAHATMVCWRVMFGEVVGEIVGAAAPVDDELALADAVADPVETHVDGLGAALFDGVVYDPGGAVVVYLKGSGGLRMAHVVEGSAEHDALFGIEEGGAEFSFRRRGENNPHDGAESVDGAVLGGQDGVGSGRDMRVGNGAAEVEVAASTATRFWLGQI